MTWISALGFAAAICSMSSFVPQAWKVIRTRATGSISTGMYAVTVVGFALWLCYGVLKLEWPIIVTNAVCLALASFILIMKLMPQRSKDQVADAVDPTH